MFVSSIIICIPDSSLCLILIDSSTLAVSISSSLVFFEFERPFVSVKSSPHRKEGHRFHRSLFSKRLCLCLSSHLRRVKGFASLYM